MLPLLPVFVLPSGTYRQEDYYNPLVVYLQDCKLYCSNVAQFATSANQSAITTYSNSCISYITDRIIDKIPVPPANPYNIYTPQGQTSPLSEPPAKPNTSTWVQSDIDIVDAIYNSANTSHTFGVAYIDFIIANSAPATAITKEGAWDIALTYAKLIIKQYRTDQNCDMVAKLFFYIIENAKTALDIRQGFNILYARGEQLDILAYNMGIERHTAFKDREGTIYSTLTDNQLKIVLLFASLGNNCNFSYLQLADVISRTFQSQVVVSSNQDMSISYYITAPKDSDMYIAIWALLKLNQLPAPVGVGPIYVIFATDVRPFFALATTADFDTSTADTYGLAFSNNSDDFILLTAGDVMGATP